MLPVRSSYHNHTLQGNMNIIKDLTILKVSLTCYTNAKTRWGMDWWQSSEPSGIEAPQRVEGDLLSGAGTWPGAHQTLLRLSDWPSCPPAGQLVVESQAVPWTEPHERPHDGKPRWRGGWVGWERRRDRKEEGNPSIKINKQGMCQLR